MRGLWVLGATGSIGCSTLQLVKDHPDLIRVEALTAHANVDRLLEQVKAFQPPRAYVTGRRLEGSEKRAFEECGCKVWDEPAALEEALASPGDPGVVILGMCGAAGLPYGLKALAGGHRLAIANKEPLVIAGHLFMDGEGEVVPVDSEHSAIFQCLEGSRHGDVQRLILTSSGGPFHSRAGSFEGVSVDQALRHPTWSMGNKITIDSATMMNKGLEMIEARWLFDQPLDSIDVTVHRQSIVHSMVEFVDGSVMAQMGVADMQAPILHAITHPSRHPSRLPRLDFNAMASLTFEPLNPFLEQAIALVRRHGSCPVKSILLNAANEVYVHAFLEGRASFQGVYDHIEKVIETLSSGVDRPMALEEILAFDQEARRCSLTLLKA